MNTKDFVVLPWGKPGNSVKLKYKNVRELRMEKIQLEFENQEMEKKLQELQSTMSKEKEERESSRYRWKSGRAGKLDNQSHMMSQNKGNVIKFSAGKVKLKLLKDQIQDPVKQLLKYKMVCLECGEDYCSSCFAKIHQKGALKLHRTTLLQAKSQIVSSVLNVAHRFIRETNPCEPKGENHSTKQTSKSQNKPKSLLLQGSSSEIEMTTSKRAESTDQKDGLLCERSFDEEASVRSFQEVLNQWRTGNHDNSKKQNLRGTKSDSMEASEVQTNLKIWREPLQIEFKEDSLSFMEKLWLRKHRRTPQDQLLNMQLATSIHPCKTSSESQCSQNENDEGSDVEETDVENPALILPVEDLEEERPEPSLKIIELDATYEEEFGEPGDIVPYKVELADADNQQSWIFHDFQKNNFPYQNDIYELVFTKGKTDLLNPCLSNISSYYKDTSKAGTPSTDFDSIADPDVCSSAIEEIEESRLCKINLKEKSIVRESNKKSEDSSTLLKSKDSLPSIDLEEPSIEEKLSQDIKESLEFNNLYEKPNLEDIKTTEPPLLLQEIALRSKPINEKYQGLERFFVFDKNERLNLLPSHSLECISSSTRITLAGEREWFPDQSLSACADNALSLAVMHSARNPSQSRTQPKMGWTSQRPSTVNLPLSNSVRSSSSCFSSSQPRTRSAVARSLSRAASEISEIEYIDITDQNEPFLDDTADQQTLENLEKELNVLRNPTDTSEKLYSLTLEELSACNNRLQNIHQTTTEFLKTSCTREHCGVEELSSSGKDTEIQSWLTLSESSTDEEDEDFLDKQRVSTLPWSKST
ncbi:zinc finger B-box domain-containing protein 1 isoform X2 [Tamandua tetradactyla]|uniref:zinc finger B-box domain-containing protein 1 isoform X2 n=1 Tax=Tamandua tetradactyla TaxID=48850 RepID=UPI00405402DF